MIPAHIPWPTTRADVSRWRDQWLAANAGLPAVERYPAMAGALEAILGETLERALRAERAVVDAEIRATVEAIR